MPGRNPWAQLIGADPAPDAPALALDRLQALASGTIDQDTRRWLRDGVRAYLASAGAISLPRALGLDVPRGSRSWARQLREADRRLHLRTAWAAVTADDVSEYRRAHLLAEAVADFERTYWPAWQAAGPPAGTSALRTALYHARKATGEPLPESWRRLRDLCSE
jgi:hypothetical protein